LEDTNGFGTKGGYKYKLFLQFAPVANKFCTGIYYRGLQHTSCSPLFLLRCFY